MAHSIGKTIAELRKAKGWTQIELAGKLNVSDKAVSKWESEGGFPEITQLPVLAKIFDVSIDYLMTGKETEPEIITMSKIELCAKNDDVKLFESFSYEYLNSADEKGKTIIDHMLKYDCKNVIKAFFQKYPIKAIQRLTNSMWNTDAILEILLTNNLIDILSNGDLLVHPKKPRITFPGADNDYGVWFDNRKWSLYSKHYRNFIVTNEKINTTLKELYFQTFTDIECENTLCFLIENKKEWDIQLLCKIINEKRFRLKVEAFQSLLDCGYINIAKHFVETWQQLDEKRESSDYRMYEKLLQIAILKQNGEKEEEINKASVLEDGIINLDKLLEFKDFTFIKKMLNEYPIHPIEIPIAYFQKQEWRKLFEYAIDNKNNNLASNIVNYLAVKNTDNPKNMETDILSYWKANINKKHLYFTETGKNIELFAYSYGTLLNKPKNIKEALKKLQAVKTRIIDELALKLDKEKTIGDLTKEYFESELKKGNTDIVIIKLCVRLEAILRCDYHYEGELSAMLEKYCKEHGWEVDCWGYPVEAACVKYLQKLRMKRNNIVHSEKNSVDLTLEELKYCIDYICKMG